MKIGAKIYYEKEIGNVIQEIGERFGDVIETTIVQDFSMYKTLSEREPETVDVLQLEYGQHAADRKEGGVITRIDLETLEPLFTYPEPNEPEVSQEPRPAISTQVDELKQRSEQLAEESTLNQIALMELHAMMLSLMPPEEAPTEDVPEEQAPEETANEE